MEHARRAIAIVIGCITLSIAVATVTYAKGVPDPHPISTSAGGTPMWEVLAFVALGVLLAVAIVGLGFSLSHSRKSEPSPRSERSPSSQPPMRA